MLHNPAMNVLASVALALAMVPQQQAKPLEPLDQFKGKWQGVFSMGASKMDVDLNWTTFADRWVEVSYTYKAGTQTVLEARVLMTHDADKGFKVWMFGTGQPGPDEMKAEMDGKTLKILHIRPNQPDLKFWIDDEKNMHISATMGEPATEFATALLKPVKG